MTPEQLLEKGIENLQTYGHQKGFYGSREEGFCAIGALRQAYVDTHTEHSPVFEQARDLLAATIEASDFVMPSDYTDPVPAYNDSEFTTAEDVLLMMKKAIHDA